MPKCEFLFSSVIFEVTNDTSLLPLYFVVSGEDHAVVTHQLTGLNLIVGTLENGIGLTVDEDPSRLDANICVLAEHHVPCFQALRYVFEKLAVETCRRLPAIGRRSVIAVGKQLFIKFFEHKSIINSFLIPVKEKPKKRKKEKGEKRRDFFGEKSLDFIDIFAKRMYDYIDILCGAFLRIFSK